MDKLSSSIRLARARIKADFERGVPVEESWKVAREMMMRQIEADQEELCVERTLNESKKSTAFSNAASRARTS